MTTQSHPRFRDRFEAHCGPQDGDMADMVTRLDALEHSARFGAPKGCTISFALAANGNTPVLDITAYDQRTKEFTQYSGTFGRFRDKRTQEMFMGVVFTDGTVIPLVNGTLTEAAYKLNTMINNDLDAYATRHGKPRYKPFVPREF